MSDTLKKFKDLAERTKAGDGAAKREFYAEAAELFPATSARIVRGSKYLSRRCSSADNRLQNCAADNPSAC
jgi:hypothetical protein